MRRRTGPWLRAARGLRSEIRGWREALHRRPELSNEETGTQRFVVDALDELGIPHRTFPRFTGVLGEIRTDAGGPVVAIRADMDALPVTEATGVPFGSEVPGRMHACGHDVHMAALLGAAALLHQRRRTLPGTVKLLFQPAEEEGETGGAAPFLERGAFDEPAVDFVVGQHVAPELPVGTIGWRKGAMYAAADRFTVRVRGRGAHAAYPHLARDPIVAASEIVVGLQTLVSRRTSPTDPVVVSVGMFHGGTRHNILPDEVMLEGTVRTLSPTTRDDLERLVRERIAGIARSQGVRATVAYRRGYPPTVNPAPATELVVEALTEEFGAPAVREVTEPSMGAEDFSHFLERVPGTFLKLGAGRPGETASLHSARFAPPEETAVVGAATLACAAVALQRRGAP